MSIQTLSLDRREPLDAIAGPVELSKVAARDPLLALCMGTEGSLPAASGAPTLAPTAFCRLLCLRDGAGAVLVSFMMPEELVTPSCVYAMAESVCCA
jgi:hypothetical protein